MKHSTFNNDQSPSPRRGDQGRVRSGQSFAASQHSDTRPPQSHARTNSPQAGRRQNSSKIPGQTSPMSPRQGTCRSASVQSGASSHSVSPAHMGASSRPKNSPRAQMYQPYYDQTAPATFGNVSRYSNRSGGNGNGSYRPPAQKTPKNRVWTIVLVVSLVLLALSGGVLGLLIHGYSKGTKVYDSIAQEAFTIQETDSLAAMTVDWATLREKNPDIVGWVYVPGTSISYPIVQGENDEEYLSKNFLQDDSLLVHKGTIFLSESNHADFSDTANFMYGHNMNDDTMFAPIMDMRDQETFDAHRTVYILTPEMNYRAETFALSIVPSTQVSIIHPNFADEGELQNYLAEQVRSSEIQPSEAYNVEDIDKLFALITCGDDYANTRAVLYAGVTETAVPLEGGAVDLDADGDGVADTKSNGQ